MIMTSSSSKYLKKGSQKSVARCYSRHPADRSLRACAGSETGRVFSAAMPLAVACGYKAAPHARTMNALFSACSSVAYCIIDCF